MLLDILIFQNDSYKIFDYGNPPDNELDMQRSLDFFSLLFLDLVVLRILRMHFWDLQIEFRC